MAIKTFGKTISGSGLAVDGERLLLQHPQTMAECMGHVVPYQMPHEDGGFLILAEYGAPSCDPGCGDPAPTAKTTCGGGCGCATKASCTCEKKVDPMAGSLLRFEIVGYSGFDTDGVTALITERGAEGTIKQEWPAGTLVVQAPTGSELAVTGKRVDVIEDYLESLGCILSVKKAVECMTVSTDEWVCHDGCWRQAKKDTVIIANDEGVLNIPEAGASGDDTWGDCWTLGSLLEGVKKIMDSACSLDWLKPTPLNGGSGRAIFAGDTEDVLSETGVDLGNDFTEVWSETISHSDLLGMGVRPTDNVVVVSMSTDVRLDNKDGVNVSGGPNELTALMRVIGCDTNFLSSGTSAIEYDEGNSESYNSAAQSYTMPLASDGSLTITGSIRPNLVLGDVDSVWIGFSYDLQHAFAGNVANDCFKAEAVCCVGVGCD